MHFHLAYFLMTLLISFPHASATETVSFSHHWHSHLFDCLDNVYTHMSNLDGTWNSSLRLPVSITPELPISTDPRLERLGAGFNRFDVTIAPTPSLGYVSARTELEGSSPHQRLVGVQRHLPFSDFGASRMALGTFVRRIVRPLDEHQCWDSRYDPRGSLPARLLYHYGVFDLVLDPNVTQVSRVLSPGHCVKGACQLRTRDELFQGKCIQYQRDYETVFTNQQKGQSLRFTGTSVFEPQHQEQEWRSIEECDSFKNYIENR